MTSLTLKSLPASLSIVGQSKGDIPWEAVEDPPNDELETLAESST